MDFSEQCHIKGEWTSQSNVTSKENGLLRAMSHQRRMDFSEQCHIKGEWISQSNVTSKENGFLRAMSHQRQSFQAKHINEGMFIEDLVM
jgi:dTDP-4-dehydrorhamnose 3,5-epimerase-like enzyme